MQLRGETPSHLITPAVHLRREDVSDLFHERFGMPPTLDVTQMTAFTSKIFDQPIVNEPTVHTQELYAALDPVVQAVLTDKNANIDALLDAANAKVQAILDAG